MSRVLPATTRYVMLACERFGYRFEDLDGGNGYLYRVSAQGRSFLGGAGNICAYPINSATSHAIARDKTHTKHVLNDIEIPTIPGRLFFSSSKYEKLHPPGSELADAIDFAGQLGYPVFCKPNLGSRGDFAEIIDTEAALVEYSIRLSGSYDAFVVEPVIVGDEYRVFVKDNDAVFSYKKTSPLLVGDGESTLRQLLEIKNASIRGRGVSDYSTASLSVSGYGIDDVADAGEEIPIAGRKNLSDERNVEDFTFDVAHNLSMLAVTVSNAIGLRVAAIDFFHFPGVAVDWQVIEVNSNPNMTLLEELGHYSRIEELWRQIIMDTLSL